MDESKIKSLSKFDLSCIAKAIAISEKSIEDGESPFGAVLAVEDSILAEGRNRTRTRNNPLAHAEIDCMYSYIERKGALTGRCTLYSSCEPCLMCLGAAHYAGITRVVWGCSVLDILPMGSDDPSYSAVEAAASAGLDIELIGGVMADQALAVMKKYFEKYDRL